MTWNLALNVLCVVVAVEFAVLGLLALRRRIRQGRAEQ